LIIHYPPYLAEDSPENAKSRKSPGLADCFGLAMLSLRGASTHPLTAQGM
jgi:hypothetical protein